MKELIELIGVAWLANCITWYAAPIQVLKAWLKLAGDSELSRKPSALRIAFMKLIDCPACLGFWLGLGYALAGGEVLGAIPYGAAASVVAMGLEFAKALPIPTKF